jgi:mono/diheme cytochrome c family protein
MTPEPNQTTPPAEPKAARRAVPVWLIVLLFLLLWWGFIYFDERSGWANQEVYIPYHSYNEVEAYQPPKGGGGYERGAKVFETYCALCHNSDGKGKKGQAPPFVGSEWVLGSPTRMIRIPQNGLSGPIPLLGATWNEAPSMAPMGAPLSDEDLAAVLTYIRQSWGNKASEVTPDQVKAVRKEVGGRSQPWTAAELNSVQ